MAAPCRSNLDEDSRDKRKLSPSTASVPISSLTSSVDMSRLPDFLSDTYKRYKEGNQRVLVWLTETAQQCGFKTETPTSTPSRRLKGKARIEARKAGATSKEHSVHISTKHFDEMVAYITAYKPAINVPNFILHSLRSTILLRQRCADWFQSKKKVSQNPVNDGHLHFIHILQNALNVLYPLAASDGKIPFGPPLTTDPQVASSNGTDMTNKFNILSIEDTAASDETVEPEDAVSTTQRLSVEAKPIRKYEFQGTD